MEIKLLLSLNKNPVYIGIVSKLLYPCFFYIFVKRKSIITYVSGKHQETSFTNH